jgi:hypothetical protein
MFVYRRIVGLSTTIEHDTTELLIQKEADATIRYQQRVRENNGKIDELIVHTCKDENVSIEELRGGSRRKAVSEVRAGIGIGLVSERGIAWAEVARRWGGSTSAISRIIQRTAS